jgi:hypothetical protein
MPVHSTLRMPSDEAISMMLYLWIPVHDEASNYGINNFNSPSIITTLSIPLPTLPKVVDIASYTLRLAHSHATEYAYIDGSGDGALQGHRLIAPMDGEQVWYCSECNDGPYGDWQSSCQSCQHSKCSDCSVEDKP